MVKGNQVHVKDGAVSQNHAEVLGDGKQWTITDLGSSNGEEASIRAHDAISVCMLLTLPYFTLPQARLSTALIWWREVRSRCRLWAAQQVTHWYTVALARARFAA